MLGIDFPERDKAIAAFSDPDYLEAIHTHDEGFGDLSIVLVKE